MKKIVLIISILFSFVVTAYSQEVSTNATPRFEFRQPIISFFTRIEGLTILPLPSTGEKSTTHFIHTGGAALSIGRRLFFYSEVASGYNSVADYGVGMSVSGGVGIGYYLLDKRSVENKGSSLKMSILYSTRYDSILEYEYDRISEYESAGLGGLFLLNYDYSFFRNFALRAGMHLGVYGIAPISGVSISYGLSLGIAF